MSDFNILISHVNQASEKKQVKTEEQLTDRDGRNRETSPDSIQNLPAYEIFPEHLNYHETNFLLHKYSLASYAMEDELEKLLQSERVITCSEYNQRMNEFLKM